MLTRFISTITHHQNITSLRLISTSVLRLGDGDHTKSKAEEKAAADLKTGKEKRWLDTVASDSEAIVKGEKQHAKKQGDLKKDVSKLQQDTIAAVKDKEAKGHLPKHDVGRRDTHEERIGSGGSGNTKQKKR
ncbi:unnamed protein product [Adineta steineri]|uniref:Uncharacterized protein n=1 Tax=Adineta steineri TaxID=433720 RepID=A0A816BAU2_9BILA|nr:unnamed protein product [Adineta steineri]CAF1385083.1 unnamed protein product [Adineta steineri]CAF1606837.1 unnamed protein product [Adineta steineri]CAF1608938.1 unnamed protein product [Adineta steineri]